MLSNQVLQCVTSIGVNAEEAIAGISKAEFSMKLSISYKEAKETESWLKLLKDTGSISLREYDSMRKDLNEIQKILWAILKKTRMSNE